jgi:lysophospholipase L1-like esterase
MIPGSDAASSAILLALGDCNTLGYGSVRGRTYVERVAEVLGCPAVNLGFTMSTTREALRFLADHRGERERVSWVTVQYGLVDSWRTFRYAPYVLYHPDNPARRLARKLVKHYKSMARRMGLNTLLGEAYVVPPEEYASNLLQLIAGTGRAGVCLIESPPTLEPRRNEALGLYNAVLERVVADAGDRCVLARCPRAIQADAAGYLESDGVHLNERGHELLARSVLEAWGHAAPSALDAGQASLA